MYNRVVSGIVQKYERLYDWYAIGPLQKCIIEDFVEEIV